MWPYDASDDKRECPVRGRNCHPPIFDSYRQMLAHCRQKHPDRLPFGGDTTTELVVTDIEGKVLSWEEMRQIIDDPSFWREPQGVVLWNRDQLLSVRIPALCPQPREADHTRDGGNRRASDIH